MLTTEELFREYIKLFTLIVETAGQTEGNKSYKEVTRVLKENEHIVKKIIEEETIEALMHKSATQQKQNSSTIADYKIKNVEYATI